MKIKIIPANVVFIKAAWKINGVYEKTFTMRIRRIVRDISRIFALTISLLRSFAHAKECNITDISRTQSSAPTVGYTKGKRISCVWKRNRTERGRDESPPLSLSPPFPCPRYNHLRDARRHRFAVRKPRTASSTAVFLMITLRAPTRTAARTHHNLRAVHAVLASGAEWILADGDESFAAGGGLDAGVTQPSVFSRSAGVFRSIDGVPLVVVAVAWLLGDADFRLTGVRLPDDFFSPCVLSLTLTLS
ncbi:hypothetical protein PUN28_013761 [Cardiocondyla obscurior]|uniref:Uncharacterized protein n=1 Tax=Cardiocondyla obscurior TaxID=286306 RepID=A0AAW2F814_9HYME